MRKLPLFKVDFWPEGILEGTANIVAENAEDAIAIARQAVEAEGGTFELKSLVRISDENLVPVHILWDDAPPATAQPVHVVEYEGKKYEAGARMPTMELVQDSADETTPRDPVNTDADTTGAGLIEQARNEANEMIKSGKIDPYQTKGKPKDA